MARGRPEVASPDCDDERAQCDHKADKPTLNRPFDKEIVEAVTCRKPTK